MDLVKAIVKVCKCCGQQFVTDIEERKYCSESCCENYVRQETEHREELASTKCRGLTRKHSTLCWSCERADHNYCSWVDHHEPVKGWQAIPVTLAKQIESYHILECPLYKKG